MDNRKHIQKAIDYIECNLKAEIAMDELCRIAGYSYVHFCRLFNHYLGMAPAEFIARRKLLNAAYDIKYGKAKINVALEYGYETYAGFYKAFKHEFNCSPSKFNKTNKKPYKINILQGEHIMVSKQKIKKILEKWNLQDETITNIYNENTNTQNENAYYISTDYIIKFTPNFADIKNNIIITNALTDSGLPVAEIVKTADYNDYLQQNELYFILTKRIMGKQLICKDIFNNTDLAIVIGENIAKLHNALKQLDENNYNKADILNDVNANINQIKEKYKFNLNFLEEFTKLYKQLPKQVIHGDINPSNMIFDNDIFRGFIDFDLTETNIRIFDICYCATAILSECFADKETDKNKWIEILNKLIAGYQTINPLAAEELQALPYVIYSIQIICISYFSKSDKYKNLAEINTEMLKWLCNTLEK